MPTNDKPTKFYSMQLKKDDPSTAELMIYDDIGESWFGGVSAREFASDLKALGDKVTQINVRMNSGGGDVFDGVAIYNSLKNHPASVAIDVDGLAASVASVILQAADERRMAANAMVMVHEPWSMVVGDSSELRSKADVLDKIRDVVADTYAGRGGGSRADILSLMADETWLTADESLEAGLVDSITGEMNVAAHVDAKKMGFMKVPARFTDKAGPLDAFLPDGEPSPDVGKSAAKITPEAIQNARDKLDAMQKTANLRKGAGSVWRSKHNGTV